MHIEDDSLRVEGEYVFLCPPSQGPSTLFYPYPADSLMGGARTVSVEWRTPGAPWLPMQYRDIPRRFASSWRLPPCRADTLEVRAVYRQELRTEYARYVVTTISGWGHSVGRAAFEIHLPDGTVPVGFSHPFTEYEPAGPGVFRFEAEAFAPKMDITVRWKKEE
jgi:hypothetical protein